MRPERKAEKAAPSGGRLLVGHSVAVNKRIADALTEKVADELSGVCHQEASYIRDFKLLDYTKKVLDHLVLVEEELQDLHRRTHQLSRRLRALQNKVDAGRRAR